MNAKVAAIQAMSATTIGHLVLSLMVLYFMDLNCKPIDGPPEIK